MEKTNPAAGHWYQSASYTVISSPRSSLSLSLRSASVEDNDAPTVHCIDRLACLHRSPRHGWILGHWVCRNSFSVAFVGGLVLWLLTTFRTPIDPQPIIMPYLVTVILFIVHVSEEFAAHVENYLARISVCAPVVWLLGAVMLLRRQRFPV